jgi:lipopolysaccharide transport system permease protein
MPDPVALPAQPIIVLEPRKGWVSLDLGALWAHREMLIYLASRDIKLRYKQTALGVLWTVIQPVFPMVVFAVFFGRLAGMPSDGIPYPAFALGGLLPWTYFANAVTNSANSVVASSSLVTKVYFPRMIIPAAAVLTALADFVVASTALVVLAALYQIPVRATMLMLPALAAILTMLALGVGMLCAALTVKYRDVKHALPILIQFWMFSTPIIFPVSIVPDRWRWLLGLNPLTGVIENFRSALFGRPFAWDALALSMIIGGALLGYAAYLFRRLEHTFADTI